MEVEYLIVMLAYFVIWFFDELYCISTKLLVIVSVRLDRGGFWLICIRDANQPLCYEPGVSPPRKTIGTYDVVPMAYFLVNVRCGTLCMLLELTVCIDKIPHFMNNHLR